MALLRCEDCNHPVSDQAQVCPSCGRPTGTPVRSYAPVLASNAPVRRDHSTEGGILAILGGTALALGPFLPWMTVGLLSASGIEKTDGEALLLTAMGTLALVVGFISLGRERCSATWLLALTALAAGGLTVLYQSELNAQTDRLAGHHALSPRTGVGIYVCFAGVALLLVSVVSAITRRRRS
jgi:hypothetical protein